MPGSHTGSCLASVPHTLDYEVSMRAPSRGVQQAVELGRKYGIIHLDKRFDILKPAENNSTIQEMKWGRNTPFEGSNLFKYGLFFFKVLLTKKNIW